MLVQWLKLFSSTKMLEQKAAVNKIQKLENFGKQTVKHKTPPTAPKFPKKVDSFESEHNQKN